MPNAIIPSGYSAKERSEIFGPADGETKDERRKAQKKYLRARKATAYGKRKKHQSKKKIKSGK